MVSPCLDNRALAVANPLLKLDGCLTTACTVAQFSFLLASLKTWSSISVMSSRVGVKALGKVTSRGNSLFHRNHFLSRGWGSSASHATLELQASPSMNFP